jgi:signal transduction histidine kinase
MIWYTFQMEAILRTVIQTDLATFRIAKGLETALLNQRGYVSYYLLEDNPEWLKNLGRYRQEFTERLREARQFDRAQVHFDLLDRIDSEYQSYVANKDRVIELYKRGDNDAASVLHEKVRAHFFEILNLCERYIEFHREKLNRELANSHREAARLRLMAGTGVSAALVVGGLLLFLLVTQILDPIRQLAIEADRRGDSDGSLDDMTSLADRVHDLIDDVDDAQMQLEQSQKKLLQSERMAVVGKLAAEVAHSIRNPLTAIKMRLFSLERTLDVSPDQKEDLEVISEEMRQLDNIVQNFLEFSRPPRLRIQKLDVSEVVNMAIQLLQKRIERHGVRVEHESHKPLPQIEGDPELLKEIIVNLIVNACEAMENGGTLIITEREAVAEHMGRAVLIQLQDTGPGVPESIQEKVFDPFFSTKDEGTGLGLAIAVRIVEEHKGKLELRSEKGKGATFKITLPIPEDQS